MTDSSFGAPGFSKWEMDNAAREMVADLGWTPGTTLENRVMLVLSRYEMGPQSQFATQQQYKVGRFKLDFAWPSRLIGLEADGPFHRTPDTAAKDAVRDAWLRNHGWLIFRIDDTGTDEQFFKQVVRACRLISQESDAWPRSLADVREVRFVSLSHQQRGRIGGLTTAARTTDRRTITEAARNGRFQKYLDQVPAEITDPGERTRRAESLRRADMIRLSAKAADARRNGRRPAGTANLPANGDHDA